MLTRLEKCLCNKLKFSSTLYHWHIAEFGLVQALQFLATLYHSTYRAPPERFLSFFSTCSLRGKETLCQSSISISMGYV